MNQDRDHYGYIPAASDGFLYEWEDDVRAGRINPKKILEQLNQSVRQ